MRLLIFLLTSFFLNAGCTSEALNTDNHSSPTDSMPIPQDSTTLYFHTSTKGQDSVDNAIDRFTNKWYSGMLYAMKEPVLRNYSGEMEVYRFTWLRTFDHPVAVRIEKQKTNVRLFAKICNGAGGYEPGLLIYDTTFNITMEEFDSLNTKISGVDFWKLKTKQTDERGTDGSEWIVEGIKNNNYHLVVRWTPGENRDKKFILLGEYFIQLSKISRKETERFY